MKFSESVKELAPALAKAQGEFKGVEKSGDNKFDHYTYAKLEDYVSVIRPVLATCGLSVLASVDEITPLDDRTTKAGGTEHAVRVKMLVRVMHTSGEWAETVAWGEGQDRADKAIYKAITGARKYGISTMLGLATTDDAEADEEVGTTAAPRKDPVPAAKPAPAPIPATPERLAYLADVGARKCISDENVKKLWANFKVASFYEMTAPQLEACIKWIEKQPDAAAAIVPATTPPASAPTTPPAAPQTTKATPEQCQQLEGLIVAKGIPTTTATAWLNAAHAAGFEDMTTDQVAKCVAYCEKFKPNPMKEKTMAKADDGELRAQVYNP